MNESNSDAAIYAISRDIFHRSLGGVRVPCIDLHPLLRLTNCSKLTPVSSLSGILVRRHHSPQIRRNQLKLFGPAPQIRLSSNQPTFSVQTERLGGRYRCTCSLFTRQSASLRY